MMYDDAVYAGRFRYQLTMCEVFILIWLPQLLDSHVAYAIVIKNITTGNWLDAGNDL